MASSLLNMSVSNAVTTKLSRTVTGGVASGHDVFSEDVGEKASKTAVCWDAFEHWWRQRTGDSQGAVPVLPESMVARLDELSEGTGADKSALCGSHFMLLKPNIYQDRLGTNTGNAEEKEMRF